MCGHASVSYPAINICLRDAPGLKTEKVKDAGRSRSNGISDPSHC